MLVMGERNKKPATGVKKNYPHKYKLWGIRIPPAYREQVRVLAEKNRRSEPEQLKILLEQGLAAEGLWPPKSS